MDDKTFFKNKILERYNKTGLAVQFFGAAPFLENNERITIQYDN